MCPDESIVSLLEQIQRELARPKAYRDSPTPGSVDADALELNVSGTTRLRLRIRSSGRRYAVRIAIASTPIPPSSMLRLAALSGRRKRDDESRWLIAALPADAEFGDVMRAGDALEARFDLQELPSAKMILRLVDVLRDRTATSRAL